MTVVSDGWTIIPVHGTVATTHLIAIRDDDELRATDIDAVLYIRTATGWDAEAYAPGVTKEDALVNIAADLALSDPMQLDWDLGMDMTDVTGAVVSRAPFGKGFFTNDPLYEAAQAMSDPEPLAQIVESSGGASASSPLNTGNQDVGDPIPGGTGDCDDVVGCLIAPQESISEGIDAMLNGQAATVIEAEGLAHSHGLAVSCCCFRWTWTHWQGNWSNWDCLNNNPNTWTLVGRTSLPGGQENCRYTRPVERTQQRTRVRRCWNCNQTAVRQTRRHSGFQVGTAGPVLVGDPCPNGPNQPWMNCTDPPNAVDPSLISNPTHWGPALPPC